MIKQIKFLLIVALMFVISSASVGAGQLEDGHIAFEMGDYATALNKWRPLAEQGNAEAQYNLGRMYETGKGVNWDLAEAGRWYLRSATRGNAEAQYALGMMAEGGRESYGEAFRWYSISAEQGNSDAQYGLCMMYQLGKGIEENPSESVKWCRKSAEQGNASGQGALGLMYLLGIVLPQDFAEAMKWLQMSAKQGHPVGQAGVESFHILVKQENAESQASLGRMFENGVGVAKDEKEALHLYRLSAAQKDAPDWVKDALIRLEKKLSQ